MKQYCRYCAFCFQYDENVFHCSDHPQGEQPEFSREQINRENHCKNFALSDLGDAETGKPYSPRKPYRKRREKTEEADQTVMSDFITVDATPSKGHGLYFDKYGTDNLDEIIEKYKEEQRNPPRTADGYVIRDGFLETIITMRERR